LFSLIDEVDPTTAADIPSDLPPTPSFVDQSIAKLTDDPNTNSSLIAGRLDGAQIELLISVLDKTLFPAVAGTEPRSSRKDRMQRWRCALATCVNDAGDINAAILAADSAIIKSRDKQNVLAAIRTWWAENI